MHMSSCVQLIVLLFFNVQWIFCTNMVTAVKKTSNHSCYTCVEPLVGYTDFPDSCRFFNKSSALAASYIKQCNDDDDDDETNDGAVEYECRKLIISYRSVDTYLRRDCVPKGRCAWKDKTQSMINTPVSDCVFTDDHAQKLECIYCCDTPLCNRTRSLFSSPRTRLFRWILFLLTLMMIWKRNDAM